jgi:hypothetical protein
MLMELSRGAGGPPPPRTAARTGPNSRAVTPLSKSPSSLGPDEEKGHRRHPAPHRVAGDDLDDRARQASSPPIGPSGVAQTHLPFDHLEARVVAQFVERRLHP